MKKKNVHTSLYRHFDKNDVLLYVGISLSAVHRAQEHRRGSVWFSDVSKMTVETFDTREVAIEAERKAIKEESPIHNIQRPSKEKSKKLKDEKHAKEPKKPTKKPKYNPFHNAKEVIDIKGERFWAGVFNVKLSTIHSWRYRGIPHAIMLNNSPSVRAIKRAGYKIS